MKKKVVALILLCSCLLMGCEDVNVDVTPTVNTVQMEYSDFDLITDQKTGIVYIDNMIVTFDKDGWRNYNHVYTPYYGRNGKPCKFVDGKVVEVE